MLLRKISKGLTGNSPAVVATSSSALSAPSYPKPGLSSSVPDDPIENAAPAESRSKRNNLSNEATGAVFFRGKLWKRGHDYLKGWKERHVVVRGCTVSYFLSDKDAIMLRNPKGVVVVTGIEDTDPDGTMWTMQSAFKKDFFLSANSIDEKHRFMEAMLLAIEVQRNQFVNVDMESDNELRVHVAIEFARYGFLESAKLQFQSVLDSDPKNVHTLFHLGTCYLIEGNEAQSVDYLQKAQTQAALSDDPLLSQINCNLGVAQYILGMFDESIKSFESVLIISPGDEDIIVNESVVHIAAKNYSSAEKLLAPLLNNSKPSKNALLNWSEVMFANGKLSASIETLQRLVQLYPDCDEGYYKLGEIFETEGSKSSLLRAAECYQSALALQSHRFKYGDAVLRVQNLLADFE